MIKVWEKYERSYQLQFYKDLTKNPFEGWSWFKFNNLGLTLGTNLKFYISVAKGLKLKVKMFLGLIPTFVEVTGKAPTFVEVREEKLVGGSLCPPSPILNRVNMRNNIIGA